MAEKDTENSTKAQVFFDRALPGEFRGAHEIHYSFTVFRRSSTVEELISRGDIPDGEECDDVSAVVVQPATRRTAMSRSTANGAKCPANKGKMRGCAAVLPSLFTDEHASLVREPVDDPVPLILTNNQPALFEDSKMI